MYLSQVRRNGVLGLIGYLVLRRGLPLDHVHDVPCRLRHADDREDQPRLRQGRHRPGHRRGTVTGDVGALDTVWKVQGVLYLAGGVLFGIALFRAHVLARWATALLAVSGLVSAALSMMPDAFYRLLAFPTASR